MTVVDMWFDPKCPWLVAGTDGFFELKRGRTRRPIVDCQDEGRNDHQVSNHSR